MGRWQRAQWRRPLRSLEATAGLAAPHGQVTSATGQCAAASIKFNGRTAGLVQPRCGFAPGDGGLTPGVDGVGAGMLQIAARRLAFAAPSPDVSAPSGGQ
jgi:hypothetical protein